MSNGTLTIKGLKDGTTTVTTDTTVYTVTVSEGTAISIKENETKTISVTLEDGQTVTPVELSDAGVIKKINDGVKIMGNGELTKKLTVQANKFTASAKEKIEAVGGKAEVL